MKRTNVRIHRYLESTDLADTLANDVRRGLAETPKNLPPKHFYDARGSDLFEQITRLPEYYQTRAEAVILADHAAEIAKLSGANALVELGSGSAAKTRLLLDGFGRTGNLEAYVPVDVSAHALVESVRSLRIDYPDLEVTGVVADFDRHLHLLPRDGTRLITFLGGTIGNFAPAERIAFLTNIRRHLAAGEALLIGTDLVKDPGRLIAAYDDAAGVTAEFNRNVLHVINEQLAADFPVDGFAHVASWDPEAEWIEMRLRSETARTVAIRALGMTVRFDAGEELRTEISAKFTRERLASELAAAGLSLDCWWTDPAGDFAVSLSTSA